MALFDKEHFGKPISEKLSSYLRTYTDKFDRADVSTKTNVGTSTVRDVVYRSNALTENNSKAIIELMRIAIKNCQSNIVKSNEVISELEVMLEEVS